MMASISVCICCIRVMKSMPAKFCMLPVMLVVAFPPMGRPVAFSMPSELRTLLGWSLERASPSAVVLIVVFLPIDMERPVARPTPGVLVYSYGALGEWAALLAAKQPMNACHERLMHVSTTTICRRLMS